MTRILKHKELKWLQRYIDKEIKEDRCNTRYCHARANGWRRKNRITTLKQEEGLIEGEELCMYYVIDFHKNLFIQADSYTISLQNHDMSQIKYLAMLLQNLLSIFLWKNYIM